MSRVFLSGSVLLLLAGCASAPRPQMMVAPHKAPIVKQAPVAVTPNIVVKKRWFKGHAIKLFH